MDNSNSELQEMVAEHLSILTNDGRTLTGIIEAAVSVLESDWSGKNKLSDEKKSKVFQGLLDAVKKHSDLIKWSIEERDKLISSMQKPSE